MSIELSTSEATADIEMVELFSIDGKSYEIPKKPRMNIALRAMKLMRTQGTEAAGAYMLEELLGEEAYDALCDYDDLDADTLQAIMAGAQKVVFGGLEGPKGS